MQPTLRGERWYFHLFHYNTDETHGFLVSRVEDRKNIDNDEGLYRAIATIEDWLGRHFGQSIDGKPIEYLGCYRGPAWGERLAGEEEAYSLELSFVDTNDPEGILIGEFESEEVFRHAAELMTDAQPLWPAHRIEAALAVEDATNSAATCAASAAGWS